MNQYRQAIIQSVHENRDSLHVYPRGFYKKDLIAQITKEQRERGFGPTVLLTPMTSIVRDFQCVVDSYSLTCGFISGSNHNLFDDMMNQLQHNQLDLLFMTIEQLANPPKFQKVLDVLPEKTLIIVDHAHMASVYHPQFQVDYHRIEGYRKAPKFTWLFLSHFASDHDIHYLESLWSLKAQVSMQKPSIDEQVFVIESAENRLSTVISLLHQGQSTQMMVTPSFSEADRWASLLSYAGFKVGCYHRKVEEISKVAMIERFDQGQLDVMVTSFDSEIGYDHPSITSMLFTFVPISKTLADVFTSRLIKNGKVYYVLDSSEDLFDAMYETLTPLDERLDQLVELMSSRSEGMMLRDCEHTMNIASYTMEKMFKVLKAYDVLERNGLAYRVIQNFQHDVQQEHHRRQVMKGMYLSLKDELLRRKTDSPISVSSMWLDHVKQSVWTIRSKKMFPSTTYPSSIIQPQYQHQEGICFCYPFKNTDEAVTVISNHIESIRLKSSLEPFGIVVSPESKQVMLIEKIAEKIGIPVFFPFEKSNQETVERDFHNPYMQVRYALGTSEHVQDVFEQPIHVILWMDEVLDGWASAVYSERLLQFEQVLSVIPLAYQRD